MLRMAKVLGIKWLIAVEDLNIKGLSRGILAGPVHDAGWNFFLSHTTHVHFRLEVMFMTLCAALCQTHEQGCLLGMRPARPHPKSFQ